MANRHKRGLAPGTLVHTGDRKTDIQHIRVMDYTAESLVDNPAATMHDVFASLGKAGDVSWIRITGLHEIEPIAALGQRIDVHPLVMEDVLSTRQRPKWEAYDDYAFLTFRMPRDLPGTRRLETEQVSLIISKDCVISFHEQDHPAFDAVNQRLQDPRTRLRKAGADYLAYALVDVAVDQALAVLDDLYAELETIEERLFVNPESADYRRIHRIRRDLTHIRRDTSPLRDVLASLGRSELPFMTGEVSPYLRDVSDHVDRAVSGCEHATDICVSLLDSWTAQAGIRMNAVMKVLTVISTVFIPLTFLVGVYGMNFEHMPELAWPWAYPVLWVIMVGLAAGMLIGFRRMRWF